MNKKSVKIYGAKTLDKYTEGILVQGFKNNSWVVENNAEAVVYQIHGAPQSEVYDKVILKKIKQDTTKKDSVKRVILLHRPDEIQLRLPEIKGIFQAINRPTGLTFLGDMHAKDSFFEAPNLIRKVIPHGFFNISEKLQTDPIIIGSHTTWGEMRSIEHIFKLLGEIFSNEGSIIGYIGGKPKEQLEIDHLKSEWKRHNSNLPVTFLDAHKNGITLSNKNVIFVDSENINPEGFGLSFNVQMYYLNNKVRTGESSGSVHSSVSVPVILEMNGSEVIEDLKVIKVPYGSVDDISTIDFKTGAKRILDALRSRSYKDMLKHNLAQSKKFNSAFVGSEYIKLFDQL